MGCRVTGFYRGHDTLEVVTVTAAEPADDVDAYLVVRLETPGTA